MSKSTDNDTTDAQWTPERWGYRWGRGTQQARRERADETEEDAPEWWTDAYEIRMRFGIPAFDPETFEYDVYEDVLIHEKPADQTSSAGGTDLLKVGERGCGKTTENLNWSARLMDENSETVIWRGSPNRSEWTPFARWATVWLPRHAEITASWETEAGDSIPVDDLDDLARSVRYYDGVLDLVDQLIEHPNGTFNVVYPDPSFSEIAGLMHINSRISDPLPFNSVHDDDEPTPLVHWWFAFMLARTDHAGGAEWWSWIFDELADLVPPSIPQDDHRTHDKLLLYRNLMQDSRRSKFSVYNTIHRESQVNWRVREEHMWRVDMPDGTPNPRQNSKRSIPQGFETVPMIGDIMSDRDPGEALIYNQKNFCLYSWPDLKATTFDDAPDGELQISLTAKDSKSDRKVKA